MTEQLKPTLSTVLSMLIGEAELALRGRPRGDESDRYEQLLAYVHDGTDPPNGLGIVGPEATMLAQALKCADQTVRFDEDLASQWQQLAGHLLPWVRRDLGKVLEQQRSEV